MNNPISYKKEKTGKNGIKVSENRIKPN